MNEEYVRALKADTIIPCAKLEFLRRDDTVEFEITDDFIADGSQLTVNNQDGSRRTATVRISNESDKHGIHMDKIFYGQKVRLLAGLILPDGSPYLLPMGEFYISDPVQEYKPTDKTLTLNLVDKWAWLDGSLNGKLDGIYQISAYDANKSDAKDDGTNKTDEEDDANKSDDEEDAKKTDEKNKDSNLFNAVSSLLKKNMGNGVPLDSKAPIFDTYYLDKKSKLPDGREIGFIYAPYTLRTEAEGTFADVLLGINTMLVSTCGYDNTGHLRFDAAQADILDKDKPVAWNFTISEREFLGASYTYKFSEMYNDVRVIGATVDGVQVHGRATNTNPRSETCVQRIGLKTYTVTQSKYYTAEQCNEYARYELKKKTMIQRGISFNCSPIYHLQENQIITLLRSDISDTPEKYLVTGFTLPIGGTGAMTINAVSVEDMDIYHNWQPFCNLRILCSDIEGLKLFYHCAGVSEHECTESGIHEIKNPYEVLQIPPGSTVTVAAKQSPKYVISSARLNETLLKNNEKQSIPRVNGSECVFEMPAYDSRLTLTLSAVSGADVNASYSNSNGFKVEDISMNGRAYRVYRFSSTGDISFDEAQIDTGILGDIYCRGGGGGGSDTADGSNGYEMTQYGVKLQNVTVTVGSGGKSSAQRGRRGEGTSFGSRVTAAGGAGGYDGKSVNNNDFNEIFGDITESKLNAEFGITGTSAGKGGAAGKSGAAGVCYLRIAK